MNKLKWILPWALVFMVITWQAVSNEKEGGIILMRHAEDKPGIGDVKWPCTDRLTDRGVRQANERKAEIQQFNISRVISSQLCRAATTARIVGGKPIEIIHKSRHKLRNFHSYEGYTLVVTHGEVIQRLVGKTIGKAEYIIVR